MTKSVIRVTTSRTAYKIIPLLEIQYHTPGNSEGGKKKEKKSIFFFFKHTA